jgi:hypothetical protein
LLGAGRRSERRRSEREARVRAKRRAKLESRDEKAGKHRNICSIRTYVLLSSPPPEDGSEAVGDVGQQKAVRTCGLVVDPVDLPQYAFSLGG